MYIMYMMTKLHTKDLNDLEIVYVSQGVLVNGIIEMMLQSY